MADSEMQLDEFETIIDVPFIDPNLLRRALTHRSFVNEVEDEIRDNERLEFLGDAVLDLIVAEMLFRRFPDVSEGELTQLRAALVRTESLAMLAADFRLGEFLLMGKGEEHNGGRERSNNLCRGFEALIGAMYIDRGVDVVRNFVLPPLRRLLDYVLEHDLHKDARNMLQERSQSELHFTPTYRVVESTGPDHDKEFFVEVRVADVVIGTGSGPSKRAGARSAARNALEKVKAEGWSDEAHEAVELYHTEIESAMMDDTLSDVPADNADTSDTADDTLDDETDTGSESTEVDTDDDSTRD
jgi:ribonuclease-3